MPRHVLEGIVHGPRQRGLRAVTAAAEQTADAPERVGHGQRRQCRVERGQHRQPKAARTQREPRGAADQASIEHDARAARRSGQGPELHPQHQGRARECADESARDCAGRAGDQGPALEARALARAQEQPPAHEQRRREHQPVGTDRARNPAQLQRGEHRMHSEPTSWGPQAEAEAADSTAPGSAAVAQARLAWAWAGMGAPAAARQAGVRP